nr:7401_t:CDS:2 [Entrophospora candida]
MIEIQLSKCSDCSVMFLVGGFSESKYLQSRIKQKFGDKLEIAIPPNPITAIVKGACEYGLDRKIISTRVLLWSYGVEISDEWQTDDPLSRRTINGRIYKFDLMARKGTEVDVNKEFSTILGPVYPNQTGGALNFFYTTKYDATYCDEPEMKKLGSLDVDMPDIHLGLNRSIQVTLHFGSMEIVAIAKNRTTATDNDLCIKKAAEISNLRDYQNLQRDYQNLQTTCQNSQTKCQNLQTNCQELEALLNSKDIYINGLLKDNDDLKKEAIKYQSALGNATSFQLGSQDSNSAGQLSKDIGNLHKNLDKFCGLKKGIKINESEVKELLRKFGCSIAGSKIHNSKNLISGVLERHVIETIIEKTQNYFNNDKGNKQDDEQDDEKQQSLEAKIVKTTEQLSKLTDSISTYRTGDEEVSKATSTKLRQQIYGVLGNRGFSNIAVGKDKKHPLIATLQEDILDLMNRYRTIKNPEKLSEIESIIDEIVRQAVNIFFFRLKVQEPVASWKFFENKTSINTIMMEASWDEDELEDLYVDICAFPIIGFNLCEADKVDKNLKVIFKAQIITNHPTRSHW